MQETPDLGDSPFNHPVVMSGYPFDKSERDAMDRYFSRIATTTKEAVQLPQADAQIEGVEEKTATDQYQPTHPTLENAGLDQYAAEEDRQAELQAARDEHNERTGDASR